MSTPSTRTAPASGRMRPRRCLRSTDLPPPLRPMTIMISPVATSRSTPLSTSWRPKDLRRPWIRIMRARSREHRAQEVVEDEDEHAGEHDGLGGGAGNAFRAVAAVEALVGAEPGHEHAEDERPPVAIQVISTDGVV